MAHIQKKNHSLLVFHGMAFSCTDHTLEMLLWDTGEVLHPGVHKMSHWDAQEEYILFLFYFISILIFKLYSVLLFSC